MQCTWKMINFNITSPFQDLRTLAAYALVLLLLATFVSHSRSAPRVMRSMILYCEYCLIFFIKHLLLIFKFYLCHYIYFIFIYFINILYFKIKLLFYIKRCKYIKNNLYIFLIFLLKGSFQRRNWTPQAMLYLKGTRKLLLFFNHIGV